MKLSISNTIDELLAFTAGRLYTAQGELFEETDSGYWCSDDYTFPTIVQLVQYKGPLFCEQPPVVGNQAAYSDVINLPDGSVVQDASGVPWMVLNNNIFSSGEIFTILFINHKESTQ